MTEQTKTMRCADERGFSGEGEDWSEREFIAEGPNDFRCLHCGWHQSSFANGCRELVLGVVWHNLDDLAAYVREATEDFTRPIEGTIRVSIDAKKVCPHCGGKLGELLTPIGGGDPWRTCEQCGNNIYRKGEKS